MSRSLKSKTITHKFTVGAISSGIGNILGFKLEDFLIDYVIDNRKTFTQGYENWENHFPEADLSDNFNDFDRYTDVIISSPPCAQVSSLAAKKGNRPFLNKLKLYDFDFIKVLDIILKRKAKFIILEYLPGLLSFFEINKTNIIHRVTREKIDFPKDYNAQLLILEATQFKISQRRKRLFLFITKKSQEFVYIPPITELESIFPCGDVLKNLEHLRNTKGLLNDEMTNHSRERVEGFSKLAYGESYYNGSNNRRLHPDKLCPTITSHLTRYVHPWEPRVLNARECATLQGFPLDFEFFGSTSLQLDLIGRTIPPKITQDFAKQIKESLLNV